MNILSFDLGASSGKLFLSQLEGGNFSFQKVHAFPHQACAINGGLYWDILRIHQEMEAGIRKAAALTGGRLDSMAIDAFSNDFAFVSKEGELLSQVHAYRDARTQRLDLSRLPLSPRRLHERTGNQHAPFNTLMQLAAMGQNGTDFMLRHCGKLLFLPGLLAFFLTGQAACEYTMASVSELLDWRSGEWCQEIISALHIPAAALCRPVPPGTWIGNTSGEVNTRLAVRGFPVYTACSHDTACAFLTSWALLAADHVTISCGTWALVGATVPRPIVTDETFRLNFANEGGYGGQWRLSRNVMGMWLLQELRRDLAARGYATDYDALEALAEEAPPGRHTIDVDNPRFYQPGGMMQKIAGACRELGAKAPQSPGEYARCIYEGLAAKFREVIGQLERVAGRRLPLVHLVGGGARARLLCRLTAAACQRPVYAGPADASAVGNACVQLIALGAASTPQESVGLFALDLEVYR